MLITDVRTYLVQSEWPVIRSRDGVPAYNPIWDDAWIQVKTDEGVDGWSRVLYQGPVALDQVPRWLAAAAIGRDPLAKEALWQKAWEVDRGSNIPKYMLGLLDVALWDITAKVAGLPLHQVLGGYRDRLPCYASLTTFQEERDYLEVIDQCLELGFKAVKLHAWGEVERDIALCRLVREHVGPEIVLMHDAGGAFRLNEALRFGRALEELDYLWFEEPMREHSLSAYRDLRTLDIPVLAAETVEGVHYTAADFLAAGAADLVRTGIDLKGGITGGMRIAHVADAFSTTAEVHGDGLANLHLGCAVNNNTFYEASIYTNPVVKELFTGLGDRIDANGDIWAPTGPGVGYEFDEAEIATRAVSVM